MPSPTFLPSQSVDEPKRMLEVSSLVCSNSPCDVSVLCVERLALPASVEGAAMSRHSYAGVSRTAQSQFA